MSEGQSYSNVEGVDIKIIPKVQSKQPSVAHKPKSDKPKPICDNSFGEDDMSAPPVRFNQTVGVDHSGTIRLIHTNNNKVVVAYSDNKGNLWIDGVEISSKELVTGNSPMFSKKEKISPENVVIITPEGRVWLEGKETRIIDNIQELRELVAQKRKKQELEKVKKACKNDLSVLISDINRGAIV